MSLKFDTFAAVNAARCVSKHGFDHKLEAWSASDWMVAILGELGEAANIIKKLNRCRDGIRGNKETKAELQAKLRKELGDVFVYLDLTCQVHGFTIEEAAVEVWDAKSAELDYPIRLAKRAKGKKK